ncbi:MAG: C4-dicarboxylate transporter [Hyphomicrobiales bacterium]|nr:C4-dicarboxylate transporter [Hyphomicrobiales bacterium]
MNRISFALAATTMLAAPAMMATAPALAQDKPVNLKISLWVPAQHPLFPAYKAWGESIEKASGGTIKSTMFPAEQLGKAFDHYDMAKDGIADVVYVNPGYQPGRFPVIAAGQIPLTFKDGRTGTKALDTWYRKYAAAEMKDTKYCFSYIHSPGSLHSRKKVTTPADMKGMKVRPAQSTIGELVSKSGGTNVQASAPEARDMLERGVADAIFFPWGSMFLFGIEKAVKFHIDEPLYATVFTTNINPRVYAQMSDAQKKVIDDHCTTEWAEKVAGPWSDYEAAGVAKMKALSDHEVYKLTPEQIGEWKKVVGELRTSWAAGVTKAGVDANAAASELEATLTKMGAGF